MMHFDYPAGLALNIWVLNSYWLDIDDNLRGVGLLVYGAYMAFNSIRCKGISNVEEAVQCISQHVRQGAMNNNACMSYLDRCWQKPMNYVR